MFLWVDLIYKEELRNIVNAINLMEALGRLPERGLTNLYDHIFLRIERDTGSARHVALRDLFSWVAYFKEPLSLFNLNEIMQISSGNVGAIVTETCASLFVLVKTGQVLLEDSTQLDTETQEGADNAPNDAGQSKGRDNPEVEHVEEAYGDIDEDNEEFDDEMEMNEKEMAEMAEDAERLLNRQREIFVHLRHASLGDYLKREDLKSTAILLGMKQGKAHVTTMMLRIVCKGAAAPQELWRFLMVNFLDQLDSLNNIIVSEADTKLIIGYLHEIFTSEALGRHIAKPQDYGWGGCTTDSFFFGFNMNQPNENYRAIDKWLRKARDIGLTKFDLEISNWVKEALDDHLKLLVPLVKTCAREWLVCTGALEAWRRISFVWQCIVL